MIEKLKELWGRVNVVRKLIELVMHSVLLSVVGFDGFFGDGFMLGGLAVIVLVGLMLRRVTSL